MYNIFRSKKKSFGQAVKAQALEQLPGFAVSTGFGLLGIGIMTVAIEVAKKATEQKKAPCISQQPQPQQPQQP